MKNNDNLRICKRCNQRNATDIICQICKTELLNNFEASSDWQIAFDIERAQLATLKYYQNNKDEFDNY
jgi:hypothetical protein